MIRELLSEAYCSQRPGRLAERLAFAVSRVLVAYISTSDNQIFLDLAMDWRVLAFTTALAVLTTVALGWLRRCAPLGPSLLCCCSPEAGE